jgi:hypothetical protein
MSERNSYNRILQESVKLDQVEKKLKVFESKYNCEIGMVKQIPMLDKRMEGCQ